MRFAVFYALAVAAAPAGAVTIIHGTGSGGTFDYDGSPQNALFKPGKTRVTIDLKGETFGDATAAVAIFHYWSIFEPGNNTDQGSDATSVEQCNFSGDCHPTGDSDVPAFCLSDYWSDPTRIAFTVNVQPSFDNCPGVLGTICAEQHYVTSHGVYGRTMGQGAYSYTVSYTAVPEPASWAMMLAGFGLAGAALRRHWQLALPRYVTPE